MLKPYTFLILNCISILTIAQNKISTSTLGDQYYNNSTPTYSAPNINYQQIAKSAQERYYQNEKVLIELKNLIENTLDELTIEEINIKFREILNDNLNEVKTLLKGGTYEQYTAKIHTVLNQIEMAFKYHLEDEQLYLKNNKNHNITIDSTGITTNYTNSDGSNYIGEENIFFLIKDGYMQVYDEHYKTTKKYGPIELTETGFSDDGFFYETYTPNVDNLEDYVGDDLSYFRINYDRKGGDILVIVHLIGSSNKKEPSIKNYFTEKGYDIQINKK